MKILVIIKVYRGREFLWSVKETRTHEVKSINGVKTDVIFYQGRYIPIRQADGLWLAEVQKEVARA